MKQPTRNKRGSAGSGLMKAGAGLLVVLLILATGSYLYQSWGGPKATLSINTGGGENNGGTPVFSTLQPSVKVQPVDIFNDSIGTGSLTYYVEGTKFSGTAGTAFNVQAGKSYEVLFDDGQHYQSQFTGTGPANGEVQVGVDQFPNGTLSTVFFNSAGTAATAQALAAADEKFVKVQFTAVNDKVFSHPNSDKNPIICFDYNTTEMDSISVDGGTPAGIPQQAVGTYERCDYFPVKSIRDGGEETIKFLLDADDSINPGCATDPVAIVYDQDVYTKTKAPIGARAFDVENDAGTDIGGVNPTVTLDCS